MPLVHVYYPEGLGNKETLEKVSQGVHRSLMEYFKIPESDYFQIYLPYPSQQFFFDPHYLLAEGQKRTGNMVHVSITCGPGRTSIQKCHLYQSIAEAISNVMNISASNIFITLTETSVENWSFGQGIAQMIDLKGEKKA